MEQCIEVRQRYQVRKTFARAGMGLGYEGDAMFVVGATMNDGFTGVLHFCPSVAEEKGEPVPPERIPIAVCFDPQDEESIRDAIRDCEQACVFLTLCAHVRIDMHGISFSNVSILGYEGAYTQDESIACTVDAKPIAAEILALYMHAPRTVVPPVECAIPSEELLTA